jgi:hypothetical protein
MLLMPGAPCRVGPPGPQPGASVAGRGGAVSISIKANSVARRAEFIPCAWKVGCQLVGVARLLARKAFARNFRPGYRNHRHEVIQADESSGFEPAFMPAYEAARSRVGTQSASV